MPIKTGLLVGIAGGSGAGKTTLVNVISKKLKAWASIEATIVNHDSYYKEYSHLSKTEKDKLNFDHPNSLDNHLFVEHLALLKQGQSVLAPVYDFATHSRLTNTIIIKPSSVILVDGILLLVEPKIREILDIKIFLDTPADIRILRRLHRDINERGRTVESVINQYLTTVRPMHEQFVEPSKQYADLILFGENWSESQLETVINLILNKLSN
jgi:uridine kinase